MGEKAGITTDDVKHFHQFSHCRKRITGEGLPLKELKLVIIAERLSANRHDSFCFGLAQHSYKDTALIFCGLADTDVLQINKAVIYILIALF